MTKVLSLVFLVALVARMRASRPGGSATGQAAGTPRLLLSPSRDEGQHYMEVEEVPLWTIVVNSMGGFGPPLVTVTDVDTERMTLLELRKRVVLAKVGGRGFSEQVQGDALLENLRVSVEHRQHRNFDLFLVGKQEAVGPEKDDSEWSDADEDKDDDHRFNDEHTVLVQLRERMSIAQAFKLPRGWQQNQTYVAAAPEATTLTLSALFQEKSEDTVEPCPPVGWSAISRGPEVFGQACAVRRLSRRWVLMEGEDDHPVFAGLESQTLSEFAARGGPVSDEIKNALDNDVCWTDLRHCSWPIGEGGALGAARFFLQYRELLRKLELPTRPYLPFRGGLLDAPSLQVIFAEEGESPWNGVEEADAAEGRGGTGLALHELRSRVRYDFEEMFYKTTRLLRQRWMFLDTGDGGARMGPVAVSRRLKPGTRVRLIPPGVASATPGRRRTHASRTQERQGPGYLESLLDPAFRGLYVRDESTQRETFYSKDECWPLLLELVGEVVGVGPMVADGRSPVPVLPVNANASSHQGLRKVASYVVAFPLCTVYNSDLRLIPLVVHVPYDQLYVDVAYIKVVENPIVTNFKYARGQSPFETVVWTRVFVPQSVDTAQQRTLPARRGPQKLANKPLIIRG